MLAEPRSILLYTRVFSLQNKLSADRRALVPDSRGVLRLALFLLPFTPPAQTSLYLPLSSLEAVLVVAG